MYEFELGAHALHGFGVAEKEITAGPQRPGKLVDDFLLLLRIEVNQDVAAEHDIEITESVLVFEIVEIEDHETFECLDNSVPAVIRFEKAAEASRP